MLATAKKALSAKKACETLGLSKDALYRKLKKLGWQSGKAKRSDAGTTAMDDQAISMLVSILNQGVRENGKRIMDITTAKSILVANGYDCLSTSQISRVLAKRNASVNALDKANTACANAQPRAEPCASSRPVILLAVLPTWQKKAKCSATPMTLSFMPTSPRT